MMINIEPFLCVVGAITTIVVALFCWWQGVRAVAEWIEKLYKKKKKEEE